MLVNSIKRHLRREESLARTDSLTSLPNPRRFLEEAERELARARRGHYGVTVAYLDVDDFKVVNDTLGHAGGDAVLVAVATTLRTSLRNTDLIARIGGDEFAMFLADTDAQLAATLLQRLRENIGAALTLESMRVSVSIGAVTFHEGPSSIDALLQPADRLMYSVKASGKNGLRHEVFDGEGREHAHP
jgi:diguanylate cyclase (GGDEF)-like protein